MSLPNVINTMLLFSSNMAEWLMNTQRIRIWIGALLQPFTFDAIDWLDYKNGFLIFEARPIALLGYLLGVLFVLMLIKKVVPLA